MTRTKAKLRPVTPVLGAEIEGMDLGAADDDDLRLVHEALIEHGVVFFRDQDISVESQIALGARFGELVVHPNDPGLEGHPEVMIIHADESSKRVAGESLSASFSPTISVVNISLTNKASRPPSGCVRTTGCAHQPSIQSGP